MTTVLLSPPVSSPIIGSWVLSPLPERVLNASETTILLARNLNNKIFLQKARPIERPSVGGPMAAATCHNGVGLSYPFAFNVRRLIGSKD